MSSRIIILSIILLMYGCKNKEYKKPNIPERISQLENVTVYSPDSQPADTVKLITETVFESNENFFIDGYIGNVAIDDSNIVYIESSNANREGIYVFKPDGNYLTTIGKGGRGPGEFKGIGSMSIYNDKIYFFDSILQKYAVFSIGNYELIDEAVITKRKLGESDSLVNRLRGDALIATEDRYLLRLRTLAQKSEQDIRKVLYYELSDDGTIMPGVILEVKRFPFYFPQNDGMRFPITAPFTRSSLVAITPEGSFFSAWTEDFLVKVYDKDGNYLRAFFYPIKKSSLSVNELDISKERRRVLANYDMPETWPALHTMELDDEGRLWVATITNNETSFTWWILNQEGKLLARFIMPGDRSSRWVMLKPLIEIKNGYFYTHEFDFHAEIDRIIKYKVVFEQR